MTMAEKILARHAGHESVMPGDFVLARVDLTMANDITAPIAIQAFRDAGGQRVVNPHGVVLVMDHFVPNKDIASATQVQVSRQFAREQGIERYYEGEGIAHTLLPDRGLVRPGQLVIGGDSHTCTYGAAGVFSTGVGSTDVAAAWLTGKIWLRVPESVRLVYRGAPRPWTGGKDWILRAIGELGVDGATYRALEFSGPAMAAVGMADRFTMANMAIEAGGKAGLVAVDEITAAYLGGVRDDERVSSDPGAHFAEVRHYDVSHIEPQVAAPSSPANVHEVRHLDGVAVDQVVIGSCTNGRLEDLVLAARVMGQRKVSPNVRLIVIPATREIYLAALRQGLVERFVGAGAVFSPPTCGPCLGGHMGILAKGERCLSTTNRNFIGRMGHPESQVYLSNPAVAAATAVRGVISHPDDVA
jgi:3-isopropylmalate/(R)-2-methylmalate dehydratase large subunit